MTTNEKHIAIDEWLNFRRRIYVGKGHYRLENNGVYETMTPIGNAKGVPEVFNMRLESLPDDKLHSVIQEIKAKDRTHHICWTGIRSDRVHRAIFGEEYTPPTDDDLSGDVVGFMTPEDMPCYPDAPTDIVIMNVATWHDFALWCDTYHDDFWLFTCEGHYPLVEEGKFICFLAFIDGKPVARTSILNDNSAAALDFDGILPEYRNKGIDIALSQHAIKHAFENGMKFIVSCAQPEGNPNHYDYLRMVALGFPIVPSV